MRVVSLNIRSSRGVWPCRPWRLRRRSVVNTLRRLRPDVVLLQEVRSDQLRFLQQELPDYRVYFAGRGNGRRRGEMLVIAVLDCVDEAGGAARPRWFSDTPDIPSRLSGARANRMCLSLVYGGVRFVNLHLDESPNPHLGRCTEMLAQWFGHDAVLAGDFNCRIDDPALAPLWNEGLHDALAPCPPAGLDCATHHAFTGSRDGSRIDHVLVPARIRVSTAFIDHTSQYPLASDHWPVVVDLDV